MYLNQTALWNPLGIPGVNKYGDLQNVATSTQIKVRRQEHVEEVRLKDGSIHHTNYIYYTNADVHVDDYLDGNLVVDSYDMRTLMGNNRLRRLKTI